MKKSTRKILIVITGCFLLLWGCEEFLRRKIGGFAGSYPFVEHWEFNIPEGEMIEIIKELKTEKSSLQPPSETELIGKRHSYWLYINFYYPESKEIIHTWIRPSYDTTKTTFAFYSLTDENNKAEHRLINRDFWYVANKMEINKFKKRILNPLKEKATHNTR